MSAEPITNASLGNHSRLDEATQQSIRSKARQIAHKAGFHPKDAGDLEQEIASHVWKRLGKFDPSKAEEASFVRMLIGHATATVLRDRKRQLKRAPLPLDLALREGETPAGLIDPRSLHLDRMAITLDVAGLLSTLPPKLRQLAEQLGVYRITKAARQLGISRSTAYSRLAQLREAFRNAGLESYVEKSRALRKRPG